MSAERHLPLASASAVAVCPDGALLIVDDDQGVVGVRGDEASPWAGSAVHDELGDLEGPVHRRRRSVYVVAEGSGTVLALGSCAARRPTPRVLGVLPKPGADQPGAKKGKEAKKAKKNKGWEGLCALPAALAPDAKAGSCSCTKPCRALS